MICSALLKNDPNLVKFGAILEIQKLFLVKYEQKN
jgi:hypothetical protein